MSNMKYRRFGRTELQMPVFSCGGMRFQQGGGNLTAEEIEAANQENLERIIDRSLELGINHIETARGYGSSEMQLGFILPKLDREKLIVQTKVGPHDDPKQFLENFEKSMSLLKLDHVDLLSFHGVNTDEILDKVLLRGGCMEVARQLQREGRVRFVGYSTHGSTAQITRANATGEFDYFNVHYYFVNELNWPAIEEAKKQDMGTFIISPSDKGGKLFEPPRLMKELCEPLTPMGFNDLWCLARPEVHTLSIGAARPSDFDAHVEALEHYDAMDATIAPIETRLRAEMEREFGEEWCQNWNQDLPEHYDLVGDVNVREILRLYLYAKSLDLVEWGKMRYNLLGNAGHWFPGENVKVLEEKDWETLGAQLKNSPFEARIPDYMRAAHELLKGEEKKRMTES